MWKHKFRVFQFIHFFSDTPKIIQMLYCGPYLSCHQFVYLNKFVYLWESHPFIQLHEHFWCGRTVAEIAIGEASLFYSVLQSRNLSKSRMWAASWVGLFRSQDSPCLFGNTLGCYWARFRLLPCKRRQLRRGYLQMSRRLRFDVLKIYTRNPFYQENLVRSTFLTSFLGSK